jgi:hypothetical protein
MWRGEMQGPAAPAAAALSLLLVLGAVVQISMSAAPPPALPAPPAAAPRMRRMPRCRAINTSWASLPLFAHVRTARFSAADTALMAATLRVVTVQGTLLGNASSEEQARLIRAALPNTPVLTYRSVYYAEPEDASAKVVAAHPGWQLRGTEQGCYKPKGSWPGSQGVLSGSIMIGPLVPDPGHARSGLTKTH